MCWALVGGGAVAIVLHGWFLLHGQDALRAPVSLGLLAATGAISAVQAAELLIDRSGLVRDRYGRAADTVKRGSRQTARVLARRPPSPAMRPGTTPLRAS